MEKLNRIRQSSVISTFTEKRFFKWIKDDISVTLRSRSGSYGGGQRSIRYTEEHESILYR